MRVRLSCAAGVPNRPSGLIMSTATRSAERDGVLEFAAVSERRVHRQHADQRTAEQRAGVVADAADHRGHEAVRHVGDAAVVRERQDRRGGESGRADDQRR